MKNILVVAAHPDDETLGCGSTLLRFKDHGSSINWLIVTAMYAQKENLDWTRKSNGESITWEGPKVDMPYFNIEKIAARSKELAQVSREYAFDSVHELCLPAMCLDQLPLGLLISRISEVINTIRPDTVILPFKSDVHSDHRICFQAGYSCTKTFRYPFIRRVMMMETLSETDFAPNCKEDAFCPNVFVNITEYMQKKNEIMSLYAGETKPFPFPRSTENIQALAKYRGATSGCERAEGFMLLKECL